MRSTVGTHLHAANCFQDWRGISAFELRAKAGAGHPTASVLLGFILSEGADFQKATSRIPTPLLYSNAERRRRDAGAAGRSAEVQPVRPTCAKGTSRCTPTPSATIPMASGSSDSTGPKPLESTHGERNRNHFGRALAQRRPAAGRAYLRAPVRRRRPASAR